jgi:cell fate regulator YaaT (PSP1 superfamily)
MNINEELKNNIINNLNNLKEKKLNSANKNKQKQKQPVNHSTNSNTPNKPNQTIKPNNQQRNTPKEKERPVKPHRQKQGNANQNTDSNVFNVNIKEANVKEIKEVRESRENRENKERKNKFDKLDKTVVDKYNRLANTKKTFAAESEEPEIEENKIDYDDFIKKFHEVEENEEKYEIVGVRFKPVGKIYFFLPENMSFQFGDKVIVETSRGFEMGSIVFGNKFVSSKKVILPLKPIMRRASEDDTQRVERNKKAAAEAMKVAEERIKSHGLKMKLIDAEYTFDNSKLIYYFTHDGRVDFRELVKDLASIFKIRIELRQVGIRDQTKVVGGLSICGRPFCCNSFLQEFETVTIKMAKDQNISINSAKISGACGRLMCCLKYEHETYEQLSKDMPRPGALVETSEGENGMVIEGNALTGMCRVRIMRAPNQRGENTDSVIKSYSKKQLKITGYAKREQDSAEEHLANLDVVVEDEPVKSGIDIEI